MIQKKLSKKPVKRGARKTSPKLTHRKRAVKKPRHNVHWTHAEDQLVQSLRDDGSTWKVVSERVTALGVHPRSPATCLQRHLYLGKTRPKGYVSVRSLPGEGIAVTITFPGHGSLTVQTRKTLRDLVGFLNEDRIADADPMPPVPEGFTRLEGSGPTRNR
jgi:hypothetical protein